MARKKRRGKPNDLKNIAHDRTARDLVRNAQSFARRQPTAFLGMAVLAGFGVVRFLKSSADSSSPSGGSASTSHHATSQGYRDEFTN